MPAEGEIYLLSVPVRVVIGAAVGTGPLHGPSTNQEKLASRESCESSNVPGYISTQIVRHPA